jgi:AcrR family transcriptional regulator
MTSETKRVGRPRKNVQTVIGDPREEILSTAAHLFEEAGFAGTTTRQIAAGAGLQPGSIFHYFATKADILDELLDRSITPPLNFSLGLDGLDATPVERLCLLAYVDALTICLSPHNEVALQFLPEARTPAFDHYWRKRDELLAAYAEQIRGGLADGTFVSDDPDLLLEFVSALVQSAVWWFRRGKEDPASAARHVAGGVLRLALADSSDPQRMVEETLARFADALPALAPITQPRRSGSAGGT